MYNGFQHDLKAVCDLAHAHGAYVYADIIQAAGAVPIDVRASGVDFAAAATYKWLMGDFGLGFLYVREDLLDAVIQRPHWSYRSAADVDIHLLAVRSAVADAGDLDAAQAMPPATSSSAPWPTRLPRRSPCRCRTSSGSASRRFSAIASRCCSGCSRRCRASASPRRRRPTARRRSSRSRARTRATRRGSSTRPGSTSASRAVLDPHRAVDLQRHARRRAAARRAVLIRLVIRPGAWHVPGTLRRGTTTD